MRDETSSSYQKLWRLRLPGLKPFTDICTGDKQRETNIFTSFTVNIKCKKKSVILNITFKVKIGSVAQKNLSWGHLSQLGQLEERVADAFLEHLWLGHVHQNLLQRVQQWSSARWQWASVIHFYCVSTITYGDSTCFPRQTWYWPVSCRLPVRPVANTTHDGLDQRVIVVNDAAEAMEEGHVCTDPSVSDEQHNRAAGGRVDVCSERESLIRSAHHWHDPSSERFWNEWHSRAVQSCCRVNDVCQMQRARDSSAELSSIHERTINFSLKLY